MQLYKKTSSWLNYVFYRRALYSARNVPGQNINFTEHKFSNFLTFISVLWRKKKRGTCIHSNKKLKYVPFPAQQQNPSVLGLSRIWTCLHEDLEYENIKNAIEKERNEANPSRTENKNRKLWKLSFIFRWSFFVLEWPLAFGSILNYRDICRLCW